VWKGLSWLSKGFPVAEFYEHGDKTLGS